MAEDLLPAVNIGGLTARDDALQAVQDSLAAKTDPFLSFAAGVERENYVSAWVNDKINKAIAGVDQPRFAYDPDYRFEDDELNVGYDPMLMAEAGSAEEAAAYRMQIDREMANLRTIQRSGWGIVGQMFGGVSNPHVVAALPLGAASSGSWMSLAGLVAGEAALETGSEVLLHQMQKTRTLNESFWNVGLVAMGVGILGGGAKMIGQMRSVPADVIDDINSGLLPGGSPEGSVSAARVVDDISAEDDRLIGGKAADLFSIGQMARLSKSLSDTARMVAGKMADNPLFTRGHAKGKTRGVSVEALHEASMGRVVIATDKAAAMQKQSGLTRQDFERQIGIAMSQGDRHANPQVQAAAEMYRAEVVGPIQEAAGRLGLLETDEGLKAKIQMVEDDIARLIEEGSGPGTTKRTRELKAAEAKIISAGQKQTDKLTKRVETLEAALEMARRPLKEGDKARKAPKSMMGEYNKARSALTKHQKAIEKKTAPTRQELAWIKAQNKRLAHTRKTLKELQAKQVAGGNLFAESYFPRVYASDKIYQNWDLLKGQLEAHFKADPKLANLEPGEITEMAIETMQNMIGGQSRSRSKKTGKPDALRARVLQMMDKELEPYLEKSASQIMLKHAQGMQPYLMMREAFGGSSLDDMVGMIEDEYLTMINKAETAEQKSALAKARERDIQDIRVMNDRLMHQVQRAINPRNPIVKAIQYSKLWNLATFLGGVVLSSIPDIARPIAHYGLRSFAKGTGKAISQAFSGKGSISSLQVKRTGAAIQRTLNDRAMQLADSLEPESKWMMKAQKFWSKATGFDLYTDIMESVAAHAAMDYVVRQAAKVASEQPLSAGARKQIARMGLTDEDLIGIYHESMRTMGAQDNVLKYMNTMQWQDVDLAKRTEAALGSDVRRTIIRIGVGEKPEFMDSHFFSWLLQFQSFAMSAQNKIMVAGFQNVNRNTAEGLVAMMFLGASVGATKSWLRGDDPTKWSAEQWAAEGIDRSGMTGILREPFNAMRFALAYYGVTDGVPSRYAGKGWERAITPPAASVVGYGAEAFHKAIGGDFEAAGEKAIKAVPMANTWHIREVLTKLGDM